MHEKKDCWVSGSHSVPCCQMASTTEKVFYFAEESYALTVLRSGAVRGGTQCTKLITP